MYPWGRKRLGPLCTYALMYPGGEVRRGFMYPERGEGMGK